MESYVQNHLKDGNRKRKIPPNICHRLKNRETFSRHGSKRKTNIDLIYVSKLSRIIDQQYINEGHIFLGFSGCNKFILSYTERTEMTTNLHGAFSLYHYVYTLYWWKFINSKCLTKVTSVKLFHNEEIINELDLCYLEWPSDKSKVMVCGWCLNKSDPCYYVTVVATPSVDSCIDCAANQKESEIKEDNNSSRKCSTHGFTAHFKYQTPVAPRTNLLTKLSLKIDGLILLNMSHCITVLSVGIINKKQSSFEDFPLSSIKRASFEEAVTDEAFTNIPVDEQTIDINEITQTTVDEGKQRINAVQSLEPEQIYSTGISSVIKPNVCVENKDSNNEYNNDNIQKHDPYSDALATDHKRIRLRKPSNDQSSVSRTILSTNVNETKSTGGDLKTNISSSSTLNIKQDPYDINTQVNENCCCNYTTKGYCEAHSSIKLRDNCYKNPSTLVQDNGNKCCGYVECIGNLMLSNNAPTGTINLKHSIPVEGEATNTCDNNIPRSSNNKKVFTYPSSSKTFTSIKRKTESLFSEKSNTTQSLATSDSGSSMFCEVLSIGISGKNQTFGGPVSFAECFFGVSERSASEEPISTDVNSLFCSTLFCTGENEKILYPKTAADRDMAEAYSQNLVLDLEYVIFDIMRTRCYNTYRYGYLRDYEANIIDVCPDVRSVIIHIAAFIEQRVPRNLSYIRPGLGTKCHAEFIISWNLKTGRYEVVRAYPLRTYDEKKLGKWNPKWLLKEDNNIMLKCQIPTSIYRRVYMLTNRSVHIGKSLTVLWNCDCTMAIKK